MKTAADNYIFNFEIKPEQYSQVKKFYDGKKHFTFFTPVDETINQHGQLTMLGVLVHGSKNGGVDYY